MASTTRRFGFTVLDNPVDQLNFANYKFSDGDRLLLDKLLRVAVEAHTHTGESISITAPDAPVITVSPTDGSLPPNAAVYYRYSIVDVRGQETIASATANVHTPVPATAPGYAPRLSLAQGYMEAGEYLYACSACSFDASQETMIGPTAAGTLADYGGWRLDLPPLPTGGHFFNIYRKGPRETELKYLVTMEPADRFFIDNGDEDTNPLRPSPKTNTTYRTNSIQIKLPATFAVPTGSWTWKLFRTFDPTNWDNSLLDWNGPDVAYVDDGRATRPGYPPSTTSAVGGAPKINILTDTEGKPPESAAAGVIRSITFNADLVQVGEGTWRWICEYARAEPQSMWATVNRSNPPTVQGCSIGLDLCRAGEDTWEPIVWSHGSTSPALTYVFVDNIIGVPGSLIGTYVGPSRAVLGPGDALRLHVYQTGYEPDAVDHDLTVAVTMRVHDGLSDQTYQWETS